MPKPEKVTSEANLPARLKLKRLQKGLSQTELAERTQLSHVHVGRIEKGQSQPTADVIRRLAEALEVSSGYLLDGETSEAFPRHSDPEIYRRLQEIEQLPEEDREVVMKLIDAFLFRSQVKRMA
jgi:transcriptional regulator with XRE-family HTH domain